MRLGSHVAVAVAVAGKCDSDLTPSLGTSMCCGCSPKKTKVKRNFFFFLSFVFFVVGVVVLVTLLFVQLSVSLPEKVSTFILFQDAFKIFLIF